MIKCISKLPDGRPLVTLGLSFANLDRLRADGLKGCIRINGAEIGIPVDIIITAGETEAVMADALAEFIGPDTVVHVAEKLKQ